MNCQSFDVILRRPWNPVEKASLVLQHEHVYSKLPFFPQKSIFMSYHASQTWRCIRCVGRIKSYFYEQVKIFFWQCNNLIKIKSKQTIKPKPQKTARFKEEKKNKKFWKPQWFHSHCTIQCTVKLSHKLVFFLN